MSKCVCFYSLHSGVSYTDISGCGAQQIMCSKTLLLFFFNYSQVRKPKPPRLAFYVCVCACACMYVMFTTPHCSLFLSGLDFLHKTSAMFESLSCYGPFRQRINILILHVHMAKVLGFEFFFLVS